MAEILKEWLSQILDRPVTWEAEEFGNTMKNGHVVASVLRSYHVINDEKHYLIRATNEEDEIKNNWKYLTEWLKEVEVNLTEVDLKNVMAGKGSSLLRLFYQLFLHLDKRDRINFIKRERKMVSNLVEKLDSRFKVNKVFEEQEPHVEYLSKPLLDERQFIQWQKQKAQQVKESFDYLHHKYSKAIEKIENSRGQRQINKKDLKQCNQKEKKEIEKFELKFPSKFHNYTYDELTALEEKAVERKKSLIDSEWANEYMNNIYQRIRKRSDSEEFQRLMGSALSNSLWNACVTEEESKVDMELAKKVMKLSQFEKQMCTQIMETKQQARNLVKNRIQGEKEYAEQREQQLNIFFDNFKEKIESGAVEIDFEQNRQNQLHKRLYAEKMRRKRQIYHDICYESLLAIVDYSAKLGYFKRLMEGDVPQHFIHEWKCLFFKQQPIFDVYVPTEEILKVEDSEETSSCSTDETITIERDRQQVLNDCGLREYLDYLYPWDLNILLPNYDADSEERNIENLGLRILGHVIYTLLETKYPYPPIRLPAELPEYSAKVLLRGLPDKSLANILQILLNFQKIHVVRLESVVNFCLREFKREMIGRTEIELPYDNFIAAAQEDDAKELIKSMKSEEEMLAKSREFSASDLSVPVLPNTKQTQTPKSLPEDDMTMSVAASLGKYAYDALTFGESLTDYLLAAMIVEYLKFQEDITGFVIINYPNTYLQAQILEESFSGIWPPDAEELNDDDDVLLEESIIKHRKKEMDVYKEIRISKMVKDPHKKRIQKPFVTYFTSYINLKQTLDIAQEIVLWELNHDNSDFIDRFYAIMGINYSLFYEKVDKDLIIQVCKFVIGDFSFPIKSFDELFGENVLSQIDLPSADVKRTNSKLVKSDTGNGKSKEKMRRSSKFSKTTLESELEVIKAPLSLGDVDENEVKTLESIIAQDIKSQSFHSIEEVKIMAGEEDWIYGELPILEVIGVSLASYWEEVEKSYIEGLKNLFFAIRLQMNCVIPYTRFLKDKMNQIINLPSNKQDYVSDFQNSYNEFENDWRNFNVSKNEWHCQVKELQIKLYQICDERKIFAQQKRLALICDNWTLEELTTLVNTYISLMQLELNRSVMSFQIMHDFYFTMLKGSPGTERLLSKDLTKIPRENETSTSKKGGDEKMFKHLRAVFQDLFIKNIEFGLDNNPFNFIIENNIKFAVKIVKDLCDSYKSVISKEYSEKAKSEPAKKKEGNDSTESSNLEEIIKQNSLKCLEEWPMGVNGEMFRFNLRILAVQHKLYTDMKLFSDQILKAFTEIQNDINTHYENEIRSVDRLCKYFHMAIEKGIKIPETLILDNDKFVIDPNVCQFAQSDHQLDLEELRHEIIGYSNFRPCQLVRLRSLFKLVAPTGIILHQAFIYFIQDFIIFGKESEEGPLFPETWRNVDPEQVQKLVFLLFGETAYVDWREFLIYCLQIPFPSIEELLHLRKKFRCNDLESKELISRENFINEELWFEKDFKTGLKQDELRLNLIKHFLFELYETEENLMNYSAFLLAFCKDIDPIKGFVAALSMAIGQEICYSLSECGEVVNKLIKDKKYRDECLACAMKCTEQFINKLIQNVINICEGTTIEELKYTEPLPDDNKKGKKSKGGKGKKSDANQSGRSDNSQKPTTPIIPPPLRTSATYSKTNFVCPPCDLAAELKEPEKEPEVPEEVEEEHVPQRDPNLCYEVSQSVIWNILRICLPWHFEFLPEIKESSYANQVQDVLKTLEVDTDNKDIYVCKLVSSPDICMMLHELKKFTAINLAEEISSLI